jgi:hypothetical protein
VDAVTRVNAGDLGLLPGECAVAQRGAERALELLAAAVELTARDISLLFNLPGGGWAVCRSCDRVSQGVTDKPSYAGCSDLALKTGDGWVASTL